MSNQSASTKIAKVAARRALDEIDGEFEQADFPSVVHALDHGAERFFGLLDLAFGSLNDGVHGVAHGVLGDIGLAELKAVAEHRDIAGVFAQLVDVFLGLFSESLEQKPAVMLGSQNLRTLRVNSSVSHTDFVDLVHQLRDQVKTKAGAAEAGDLAFRRENYAGVLDRVLEIVFGHFVRYGKRPVRKRKWQGENGNRKAETGSRKEIRRRGRTGRAPKKHAGRLDRVSPYQLLNRGIRERDGRGGAVTAGMPAMNRVDGKENEGSPNQAERDQMIVGERFVIKKNAEEKAAARGDVLQEADCGHAQMPGGVSEPDQRQTGHNAGADK